MQPSLPRFGQSIIASALALCSAGCQTGGTFAPVDLSAEGWTVQRGQAVWKASHSRPELTGELLLATNQNGHAFVQFSKDPFPIATAQTVDNRWQIQFGTGQYIFSGKGPPPNRFSWFQLPHTMAGENPTGKWQFRTNESNAWQLTNPRTGESLEGAFFP